MIAVSISSFEVEASCYSAKSLSKPSPLEEVLFSAACMTSSLVEESGGRRDTTVTLRWLRSGVSSLYNVSPKKRGEEPPMTPLAYTVATNPPRRQRRRRLRTEEGT